MINRVKYTVLYTGLTQYCYNIDTGLTE